MFKDYDSLNDSLSTTEDEIVSTINEIKQIDTDNLMDEAEYNKCRQLAQKLNDKFSLHEFLVQEIIS